MRSRLLVAPALAFALTLAGCGGTPTAETEARVEFLQKYQDLEDFELAGLCPSLYPSDFRAKNGEDDYRYTKPEDPYQPTAEARADAEEAGCTDRGTPPDSTDAK